MRKIEEHSSDGFKNKRDPRSEPFIAKVLEQEAAQKLTRINVLDSCGANIVAGSDTTGISLSAALYYLYRNPGKLAKLKKEVDQGQATGQVSDPVTFKESQNMPYLQAVIKEALRMHPAVGTILARTVPEGGAHLVGVIFRLELRSVPTHGSCTMTLRFTDQIRTSSAQSDGSSMTTARNCERLCSFRSALALVHASARTSAYWK